MNKRSDQGLILILRLMICGVVAPVASAQDAAELARKLSNPVAALISVPLQYNYDEHIGPTREGEKSLINIQPVIPIEINADWNLISRTILPLVSQKDILEDSGKQSGTADTLASGFFSPKEATKGGWIWGVGPVLLIPTGSDSLLGGEKWGTGATALVLKQQDGWTYGALVNQVWSFAGNDNRSDVNSMFLQPFLSHSTATAWTFGLNAESTYNWDTSEWSIPLNLTVSKVTRFGSQLVSLGAGVRYWADNPESGAHDVGARLIVTLLFPKK